MDYGIEVMEQWFIATDVSSAAQALLRAANLRTYFSSTDKGPWMNRVVSLDKVKALTVSLRDGPSTLLLRCEHSQC